MKYFAYGSNMSPSELNAYCPNSKFINIARLDGYRLEFTRFSHRRQGGVADIVPHEGQTIWGVLYEVPGSEGSSLDRKEGYPSTYEKAKGTVATNDGAKIEAMTYIVVHKDEDCIRFLNTIPSVEY